MEFKYTPEELAALPAKINEVIHALQEEADIKYNSISRQEYISKLQIAKGLLEETDKDNDNGIDSTISFYGVTINNPSKYPVDIPEDKIKNLLFNKMTRSLDRTLSLITKKGLQPITNWLCGKLSNSEATFQDYIILGYNDDKTVFIFFDKHYSQYPMIMSKFIKTPITLTYANSTKATSITNWIVESKFEKLTSIVEAATKFNKIAALTKDQKLFCLINNIDISRATFKKNCTVKYNNSNRSFDWYVVVKDFLKIGNTYRNIETQHRNHNCVVIYNPEYVPPNISNLAQGILIVSDVKKTINVGEIQKFDSIIVTCRTVEDMLPFINIEKVNFRFLRHGTYDFKNVYDFKEAIFTFRLSTADFHNNKLENIEINSYASLIKNAHLYKCMLNVYDSSCENITYEEGNLTRMYFQTKGLKVVNPRSINIIDYSSGLTDDEYNRLTDALSTATKQCEKVLIRLPSIISTLCRDDFKLFKLLLNKTVTCDVQSTIRDDFTAVSQEFTKQLQNKNMDLNKLIDMMIDAGLEDLL